MFWNLETKRSLLSFYPGFGLLKEILKRGSGFLGLGFRATFFSYDSLYLGLRRYKFVARVA